MAEHDLTEVFYDAACPVCRASRRWAERHDSGRRLVFCDLNDPTAANTAPAGGDGPADAMWVRLPGGEIAAGFAGWLAVLGALPRWRPLARVLASPLVRWAGPPVYRFVARYRHGLPIR